MALNSTCTEGVSGWAAPAGVATGESLKLHFLTKLTLYATIIMVAWQLWLSQRRPANFPDGPGWLPFLGNLSLMFGDARKTLSRWAAEYGAIYSLKLGNQWSVVINDFEMARRLYKKTNCNDRPEAMKLVMSEMFCPIKGEPNGGIVFTDGIQWRQQRSFLDRWLSKTTKNNPDYNKLLETAAIAVVDNLKKLTKHEPLVTSENLRKVITVANNHVIQSLFTGNVEYSSEELEHMLDTMEEFIHDESVVGSIQVMPMLRYLPYIGHTFAKNRANTCKIRETQENLIKKKLESRTNNDPNDCTLEQGQRLDYVKAVLNHIALTGDEESSFYRDTGHRNLARSMTEFFGAGSDTTSTLISFVILVILRNPEVGHKISQEISDFQGKYHDPPCVEDKNKMPYLLATIYETLRMYPLLSLVPHATAEDLFVDDDQYKLPQGTTVYVDLNSISHDPRYFEEPNRIMPDRFIGQNEDKVAMKNIGFSVGRRICPGRHLAVDEAFIMLFHILQKCRVESDGRDSNDYPENPKVGFLLRLPQFGFKLVVAETAPAATTTGEDNAPQRVG